MKKKIRNSDKNVNGFSVETLEIGKGWKVESHLEYEYQVSQ